MNIIANLFRDVGEPNTGLTPAVEEIARAVMCRMSRAEGHGTTTQRGLQLMVPQDNPAYRTLRAERAMKLIGAMADGDMTRLDALDVLNMADGNAFAAVIRTAYEAGCIAKRSERFEHGVRTIYSITDVGRRALELGNVPMQVAAE